MKIYQEMFQSTQIMAELMDSWFIYMTALVCLSSTGPELQMLIRLKEKFPFFSAYLMPNRRQEMQDSWYVFDKYRNIVKRILTF